MCLLLGLKGEMHLSLKKRFLRDRACFNQCQRLSLRKQFHYDKAKLQQCEWLRKRRRQARNKENTVALARHGKMMSLSPTRFRTCKRRIEDMWKQHLVNAMLIRRRRAVACAFTFVNLETVALHASLLSSMLCSPCMTDICWPPCFFGQR